MPIGRLGRDAVAFQGPGEGCHLGFSGMQQPDWLPRWERTRRNDPQRGVKRRGMKYRTISSMRVDGEGDLGI